jgi:hypothetical protein
MAPTNYQIPTWYPERILVWNQTAPFGQKDIPDMAFNHSELRFSYNILEIKCYFNVHGTSVMQQVEVLIITGFVATFFFHFMPLKTAFFRL